MAFVVYKNEYGSRRAQLAAHWGKDCQYLMLFESC